MENRTELGMNRTGMQMAPMQMGKMKEVTDLTMPSSEGSEISLVELRAVYIEAADPVGTVPPPMTVKGVAKSGMNALKGQRPHVFLDKLGERLAFERTGTRLYDALIGKCESPHEGPDVLDVARLRHFRDEEAQHFRLCVRCIEKLGGDPTAQTPCADVAGVESMGLMQVITDPKTTVNQSLHAVLIAELADNAAWEELIMLARDIGQDEMVPQFEEAARHEAEHLQYVRECHQQATLQEAKISAG